MMKYVNKKLLSMLIVFTLLLGMLPAGSIRAYALDGAVCSISEIEYATLDEALLAVKTGEIIKLLQDINYGKGITVNEKTITFDVGSFTLNITNISGPGLKATKSNINLIGTGKLNATGKDYGIYADNSTVTINNASAQSGTGAYAINGGIITANGFVSGSSIGAKADGAGSKIDVKVSAYGGSIGVRSANGGEVCVTGDTSGKQACFASGEGSVITINGKVNGNGDAYAIQAQSGGTISITGNVKADNSSYAIFAELDSKVTVIGNVTGNKTAIYSGGNAVGKFGEVEVTGNVNGGTTGVYAIYGGKIHIDGNVEGWIVGASCKNGDVFISGDVQGEIAVTAESAKSNIIIEGNVISYGKSGVGVSIDGCPTPATTNIAGTVRVDGVITTQGRYIEINGIVKDGSPMSRDDINIRDGYHTYSEVNKKPIEVGGAEYATSFVWVKGVEVVVPSEKVCSIGATQYATLDEALDVVQSGDRITLLKNINYNKGVVITNKHIIFDVGQYILNIINPDGVGLDVSGIAGRVSLSYTTGELNVSGTDYGLRVWSGGKANVTNAIGGSAGIASFDEGSEVTAYGNVQGEICGVNNNNKARVEVKGNVTGVTQGVKNFKGGTVTVIGKVTGTEYGVYAEEGGIIHVFGDIEAETYGARIHSGGIVWAKGDIIVTGANNVGAWIRDGVVSAEMIVDGEITANNYIKIRDEVKTKSQGIPDPNKLGYLQYSPTITDIKVWVKDTTPSQIGETFNQITGGIPLYYKILTDEPSKYTVELIWNKNYVGQKSFTVPRTVVYNETTYTVTSIGEGAFYNCKLATSITIPESVTNIGKGAFKDCHLLENFTIPILVNKIGEEAFAYCAKLSSIIIPGGVTKIEDKTFRACGITSMSIPNGVISIGVAAFDTCGLLKDIIIPQSVTSIGESAFNQCSSLQTINLPNQVTSIEVGTFSGCSNLTDINIHAGITEIGKESFKGCESLTEIHIPTSATSIEDSTFAGCKSLTKIDIPDGVKGIGEWAFSGCENLTTISFPAGVTNIGNGAFNECTKLKSATFFQQNPPSFGSKSFPSSVTTIYVPLGCTVKYQPYTEEGATLPNAQIIEMGAYKVTVDGSHSITTGAESYPNGATVTINAGTYSGYSFAGWTSPDSVAFSNKDSATTTFTMPAKNVTVTATWNASYSGDSSNDGGLEDDSSHTNIVTTTINIIPGKGPEQPLRAVVPIVATADKNGIASINIPDKTVADAIAKAQAYVKTHEKISNGVAVELDVTMPQGSTSLSAVFSQKAIQSLVNGESANFGINSDLISINLDLKTLKAIQSQSSGNVSINIAPVTNISENAKKLIGTRPVYDIVISYMKNGKTTMISDFDGGKAIISIPYTPTKGEFIRYLHGVYVDNQGNATGIQSSHYDANEGAIIIPTEHLSVYGVGYTDLSNKFIDINNHWAKESIDYVVGRGLISGTSETTFAPSISITRGMMVIVLGRLAGVDTKLYTTNNFIDVKADSAFRPYIEWAYKNGIVQGKGSNKFDPDCDITREEIAVIFARYSTVNKYILPTIQEVSIYADNSSIGSIYQTAVKVMQQAGIMMGGTGNKFNPKSSATRAEVVTMLHRYIKLAE